MSRYIDADEAFDSLRCIPWIEVDAVKRELDDVPIADVRENVRGEWSGEIFEDKTYVVFSECGHAYYLLIDGEEQILYFCPFCGADMRGDRE